MIRPLRRLFFLALCAAAPLAPARACDLCHRYFGTSSDARVHALSGADTDEAQGFRTQGNGWSSTASGGSSLGNPARVTWGVVPNGTNLPTGLGEPSSPSSLVSFLDGVHHGGTSPGGGDLMQRTWWQLINSAFERWESLSGVTFEYEPADDAATLGSSSGVLGTRADIRIGGHPIDGQTSPTFLAYSYFPNNSDIVIDTDEINRWSNASGNYLLFRNMLAHEIGHGLGLAHVESADVDPNMDGHQFGTFLMEPKLSDRYDGPQLDDVLGIHRLYGDKFEKGSGNDSYLNAIELGFARPGQPISLGADAVDTYVDFDEVDFVSIDDNSDVDFFRFSVLAPIEVDFTLTPLGPTYLEGSQGSAAGGTQSLVDSSALGNLQLTLYVANLFGGTGLTELATSNSAPAGEAEAIQFSFPIAGEYFLQVRGFSNAAQFYQLDVVAVPEPTTAALLALSAISLVTRRRRSRR
jgi:hypothetical protein